MGIFYLTKISTAQIEDGAVTEAKLAPLSVSSEKIQARAVGASHIVQGVVQRIYDAVMLVSANDEPGWPGYDELHIYFDSFFTQAKMKLKGVGVGKYFPIQVVYHDHPSGTLVCPSHRHESGSLVGYQPAHNHGGVTGGTTANHSHGMQEHTHPYLGGTTPNMWTGPCEPNETTGQSNDHQHEISSDGDDAVTISGETAASGDLGILGSTGSYGWFDNRFLNGVKVEINGIDRTPAILSRLGWAQIGDGTADHPLYTTGSPEVEIADFLQVGENVIRFTHYYSNAAGRMLVRIRLL